MPITDLLEENARKFGSDVALVEVNPQVQETRRVLWKDYDLIQPTSSFVRSPGTYLMKKQIVLHSCS